MSVLSLVINIVTVSVSTASLNLSPLVIIVGGFGHSRNKRLAMAGQTRFLLVTRGRILQLGKHVGHTACYQDINAHGVQFVMQVLLVHRRFTRVVDCAHYFSEQAGRSMVTLLYSATHSAVAPPPQSVTSQEGLMPNTGTRPTEASLAIANKHGVVVEEIKKFHAKWTMNKRK